MQHGYHLYVARVPWPFSILGRIGGDATDPELLMCSTRTLNYAPKEEQKWMLHSTIALHFQTRPFANRFLLPNPADLRLYSELPTTRAQGTHKGHKV